MLNRKALFSLVAVAALAVAAALTVNSASAAPNGPKNIVNHGGKGGGGGAWKGPGIKGPGIIKGPVAKLPKPKFKPVVLRPHWCFKHPWRCHRPVFARYPLVTTGVATAVMSRPAASCTCLTKQYLPDGSVLFKDVCTQEAAINPPNGQQAQAQ